MSDSCTTARLAETVPERINRLRDALGVVSFGISQIVLEPGQRNRLHRHREQEEVYLVLAGELTISFAPDEARTFGVGELIRVAPETLRRLENRGSERVSLLAVGSAGPAHQPRDGEAFTEWGGEPAEPASLPFPPDFQV